MEKKPIIRFSFDDAGRDDNDYDDARLANLLRKYNIKNVIFYCQPFNHDIIKLLARDFEIGGHTVTHAFLNQVSREQARWEINECKNMLEHLIRRKIKSFCYPRGRYNIQTKRWVKEAGFKEARTTRIGYINKPESNFELHTTAHACPIRPEYDNTSWFEEAIKLYDKVIQGEGDYYHLWGHAWEISKYNLWSEIEELFEYIRSHPV